MITHALDPHTHSCQSRCKRVHVYETEEMYRAGRAFGHVSDIPAPAQRGLWISDQLLQALPSTRSEFSSTALSKQLVMLHRQACQSLFLH